MGSSVSEPTSQCSVSLHEATDQSIQGAQYQSIIDDNYDDAAINGNPLTPSRTSGDDSQLPYTVEQSNGVEPLYGSAYSNPLSNCGITLSSGGHNEVYVPNKDGNNISTVVALFNHRGPSDLHSLQGHSNTSGDNHLIPSVVRQGQSPLLASPARANSCTSTPTFGTTPPVAHISISCPLLGTVYMTGTTPSNKTSKGKEKDTGTPRFSSRIASKSGGSGSYASKFAQSIADKSNTGDIKSKVPPADPTQEDSISGGHVETSESSTSRLSTTVVSLTADPKASSTTPTDNSNGVDPSRNGFTSSASEGGGLIPPSTGNGQDGTLDDLKIPSIPPAGHGSISSPTGATGSTVTEVPQVSSNISGPTVPYPVPANPLVLGGHLQHVDGTSNFQWGYVQGPHGLSLVPYPVTTTPPMVPSMPSTISSMGDIYGNVMRSQPSFRDALPLKQRDHCYSSSRRSSCSRREVSRNERTLDSRHSSRSSDKASRNGRGHRSRRSRDSSSESSRSREVCGVYASSSRHSRTSKSSRGGSSNGSRRSRVSRPEYSRSREDHYSTSSGSRHSGGLKPSGSGSSPSSRHSRNSRNEAPGSGRSSGRHRSRRLEPAHSSKTSRSSTSSRRSSLLSEDPNDQPQGHVRLSDGFGVLPDPHQGNRFYQPPSRAPPSYGSICPGCGSQPCRTRISMKDFDVARSISEKKPLKPRFKGEGDLRSGSTIVREIDTVLEGHDAVTRYLWANSNIEPSTWRKLIKDMPPPAKCYLDYEKHLDHLLRRIRSLYDNDDSIAKAKVNFVMCEQGKSESLSDYIKRLESIVTELHLMGIMTYEYDMKRRLYDGLQSDYLRDKVDNELGNSKVSFDDFTELLSSYERRRRGRVQRQVLYDQMAKSHSASIGATEGTTHTAIDKSSKPRTSNQGGSRSQGVHSIACAEDDVDSNPFDAHVYAVGADSMSIQCYRCLASGHPARLCRGKISNLRSRCSKCGNPNHSSSDCQVPDKALYCQRCRTKGHLPYVCPAGQPILDNSKAPSKESRRLPQQQGKPNAKPKASNGPSTPTTNAKVSNQKGAANLVSSKDTSSYLKVSAADGPDLQLAHPNVLHSSTQQSSSSYSTPQPSKVSMVVGDLSICGVTRPVLYDTGADVSLIAISTLQKITKKNLLFDDPSIVGHINVANGSSLSILGKVELNVGFGSTFVKDTFLLASNELSTPVIIGCSTMAKLRTTISLSPDGVEVLIGDYRDIAQVNAIESNDGQPSIRELDWARKVMIMHVGHYSNVVPNLYEAHASKSGTLSMTIEPYNNVDFMGCLLPLYEDLYDDAVIYPKDSDMINHGTVSTFGSLITDVDSGSHGHDLLPPWEAISRRWVEDSAAPLGRSQPEVPWKGDARPPYNFYYAAKRGLASIARLDQERQSMFEGALAQLLDKGFCSIVCDLREGIKKPTKSMCSKAWSTLVKGTIYEGTTAPLPEHYTPSHLVFRPSHPSTPCRIVFDFRALNRFSLRGGYPQNHLVGAILGIRSNRFFAAGDLSKAFCRMSSSSSDVPFVGYTCIGPYVVLWSRVAFGSSAAPCQLEASMEDVTTEIDALSKLAAASSLPIVFISDLHRDEVEACLLRSSDAAYHYLSKAPSIPKKVVLIKFVDDIYAGGSTKLEAANNYDLIAYICNGHDFPLEDLKRYDSWTIALDCDQSEKRQHLLGYDFTSSNDSLYCSYSGSIPSGETMTKRQSCGILASFYDPLGLMIEHDMFARSIWRDINKSTPTDWEAVIPSSLTKAVGDWSTLSRSLSMATPTPRYVPLDQPLVLSTDASANAWGADLRSQGDLSVRVAARGGLFNSSNLSWSIPRKELDALHRGLIWVKSLSPYLPLVTHYSEFQAPLNVLFPLFPDQPLTVVTDSEVTVYRLRRPSNDDKLPAPERRRLAAVRQLCLELHAHVKHVASSCNPADSISRCNLSKSFDSSNLSSALDALSVTYRPDEKLSFEDVGYALDRTNDLPSTSEDVGYAQDQTNDVHPSMKDVGYPSTPLDPQLHCCHDSNTLVYNKVASLLDDDFLYENSIAIDDFPVTPPETTSHDSCLHLAGTSMLVNSDGLNLPSIPGLNLSDDEKEELWLLLEFVDTTRGVPTSESTLDNIEFQRRLTVCARRCQSNDVDLSKFRDYLEGKTSRASVGLRQTVFQRLSKHCSLDNDGLIRQRRWYGSSCEADSDDNGTIYLGSSSYAYQVVCILAAIYHYSFGHPGQRRLRSIIKRRFTARGITTAVRKTTSSCTLCLRARASKSIRYLNSDVQDMVVTQLWQLVGVDVVGPYGRGSLRQRSQLSSNISTTSSGSQGDSNLDQSKDYYVLVCQDAVSGYIAARSMRNSKATTIAMALHSIFCEHGSPSVLVSDRAVTSILSKPVRSILIKHGTRQYSLPGYSQHLSFWERSHRDLAQTSRAIMTSSATPEDYIYSYLLAIRSYNSTPRHWSTLSPSTLHYAYRQRLPADPPTNFPSVDWDKLEIKYLNVDYLPYVRSLLPTLSDLQEKTKATVQEYIDSWRSKQADLRERSIKETPQDYKLNLYDLVYMTESTGNIGRHLDTKWRGPLTVARLAGTSMAYLFDGILLPNDYGGNLRVSQDGNCIEGGLDPSTLVYASLKNLVPAKALQSLVYDHLEKGVRVYRDADGGLSTMPASVDGSDQSKILLRQARGKVASDRGRRQSIILPGCQDPPLEPLQGSSSSSSQLPAEEEILASTNEDVSSVEVNAPSTVRRASSSSSLRPPTTPALTFGCSIPSSKAIKPGWLVISIDASTYRGLAVTGESDTMVDLVPLQPLFFASITGVLSVSDGDVLHHVPRSQILYVTSSIRPLTRSLLERTRNLLERLGL